MSEENFRIRIGKDGRIYFHSRQLGEERARQLREMLEDCLGQVQLVQPEGGEDDAGGTRIVRRSEGSELNTLDLENK